MALKKKIELLRAYFISFKYLSSINKIIKINLRAGSIVNKENKSI